MHLFTCLILEYVKISFRISNSSYWKKEVLSDLGILMSICFHSPWNFAIFLSICLKVMAPLLMVLLDTFYVFNLTLSFSVYYNSNNFKRGCRVTTFKEVTMYIKSQSLCPSVGTEHFVLALIDLAPALVMNKTALSHRRTL
jgi:hypothetical protein